MRKTVFGMVAAGILSLIAGCMDFDYVGQEFAPTPESDPVTYYKSRSDVPAGVYGIIGRAVVKAPDGTDGFDIQELLLDRARQYGADAVCQVSAKRIVVGTYSFSSEEFGGPNPFPNPGNLNPDGSPIEENTFGDTVEIKGERKNRYVVEVKALFLKNKKELETLLEERGRELERLIADPAPAPEKAEKAEKAEESESPAPAAPETAEESESSSPAAAPKETEISEPPVAAAETPAAQENADDVPAAE